MPDALPCNAPATAPAPRSLRVLQIGVNWFQSGSGGLDRVFHDLQCALPGAGITPTGLVLGPPDVAARTGGRVLPIGGSGMGQRLWRARRAILAQLATGRHDLVAAHFAMFSAPALDRLRQRPFVVHFHGPWAAESAAEGGNRLAVAAKRALEGLVYRQADRVLVLSEAFGLVARETYGVAADRIRHVPGSVDVARFALPISRNEARAQLGWPADRRILLTVRRLAARMGLDRLLTAMVGIVRAHPDVLLMIGGRGAMEAALKAQMAALGLDRHVRFLGFVPDAELPIAFRAAELALIPTLALEGFGLTSVEALAAGTPVLVSPVGGLPEVVRPLSPDLVFASSEPADIADRVVAALAGSLRLPSEADCRAYAAKAYSAERAAIEVARVYREVA